MIAQLARQPAPDDATVDDLSIAVTALETEIAEQGLSDERRDAAHAVARRAAAAAREAADSVPDGAVALMDASRAVAEALLLGADPDGQERALVDALDDMHVALLVVRENRHVGEDRPVRDVAAWVMSLLGVSQRELAQAVGVPDRTLQRWLAGGAMRAAEERRLRLALRGLNELRFVLRGSLALAWLAAPDPGTGRAPRELLDEPEAFLRAVLATRF